MDKVLRVSEATHRAAKIEAVSRGMTLSEFVDKALRDYMDGCHVVAASGASVRSQGVSVNA